MIAAIKTYISIGTVIIALVFGVLLYVMNKERIQLNEELRVAVNNYKAEVNKNRVYQLTIDEMKISNDSADLKVLDLMAELKIKPKKVVETIYISSVFEKIDTVQVIDSIFNKDFNKVIGDKWYKLDLKLIKPNKIITDLKVVNEVAAIAYDRRETIKPRKKFFISRWFQAKQTVQIIEVKELNPYSTVKDFKIVTIKK